MLLRTPQVTDIAGKTVLVRVDYNVPLSKTSPPEVLDARRIDHSLETIAFLIKHKAKVILISHLGRPKSSSDARYSLKPVGEYLAKTKQLPAHFLPATLGEAVTTAVAGMQPGTILLLENLRFFPEEKKGDQAFAKALAKLADVYINEAFSNSHRSHASMVGVPNYLPSFAGLSLAKEVRSLGALLEKPKRPFVVVLGGAKISDKVGAVKNLAQLADIVLVGGAVANNFLKAEGLETFRSYTEEASSDLKKAGIDYTAVAKTLMEEHKTERMLKDGYIPLPKILHPIDVVAAPSLETKSSHQLKTVDLSHDMADKPENKQLLYLDIGPKTTRLFSEIILQAGTIFWNGPMGVWENPLFANGTKTVAQSIASSSGTSVLGGGDTIAAIDHFKMEHDFSYVSAAGGAALDFLGGTTLPALKPLLDAGKEK